LTNTIADRHLFYNLPTINVKIIKISFTVEYDKNKKKKTQNKQLKYMTPFVIELLSTIFLAL